MSLVDSIRPSRQLDQAWPVAQVAFMTNRLYLLLYRFTEPTTATVIDPPLSPELATLYLHEILQRLDNDSQLTLQQVDWLIARGAGVDLDADTIMTAYLNLEWIDQRPQPHLCPATEPYISKRIPLYGISAVTLEVYLSRLERASLRQVLYPNHVAKVLEMFLGPGEPRVRDWSINPAELGRKANKLLDLVLECVIWDRARHPRNGPETADMINRVAELLTLTSYDPTELTAKLLDLNLRLVQTDASEAEVKSVARLNGLILQRVSVLVGLRNCVRRYKEALYAPPDFNQGEFSQGGAFYLRAEADFYAQQFKLNQVKAASTMVEQITTY